MSTVRLFIHNPKTAGTSLVNILGDQIYLTGFKRINPTRDTHPKDFLKNYPQLIKSMPAKQLAKIKMIGGHFAYGVHRLLDKPTSYVTILRNPVERVISEYYYMKQKGFYHQGIIIKEGLSLEDYLYHPETYYLNNLQTRLISGVSYDDGDEVTEEVFQEALSNLSGFEVVGITEQLAETLALFYIKLSWSRVPVYTVSNVNDEKPDTDSSNEQVIAKIKTREKFDIRLYEAAQKRFDSDIEQNRLEIDTLKERIKNPSSFYKNYLRGLALSKKIRNRLGLY